jgi:hypothetical protein
MHRNRYNFNPPKVYVECLNPGNGAYSVTGLLEIDHGEYIRSHLFVDDNVDDSQDIIITYTMSSDESDATENMKIYVECRKTDNSEASSWNVENGTAFTFDSTNADRPSKYQYTLSASDYEAGDVIATAIENNTTTATITVTSCTIELSIKD